MDKFFDKKNTERMGKVLLLLALVVVLFMGMKFVNETKKFSMDATDSTQVSTIDVTGTGESFAIPNVATESFTVESKGASVRDAQAVVSKKVTDAISFLKSSGVADKDIQTANYSAYPNYSNPCGGRICVNTEPTITGYSVSETISVKIRDTSAVGKIIDGLGSRGVTGLSGPDFSVDNPDAINAEARRKAIADAKGKAEVLARDLGVRLVRIVRFSESTGGAYPMPMYAKADMAVGGAAPTSALPTGQNKFTSNVTVTYEIR